MSVRFATVRVLVVAVIAGVALTAAPAPAATPAAVKYGSAIFTAINVVRVKHDRPKLKRIKCLQRFARKQARAMADQQKMFHQDLGKIQRACHMGWVGENVAYGPFPATGIVQMWMSSPPHRANILSRHYRLTGTAGRFAGGVWWVSQVFGGK